MTTSPAPELEEASGYEKTDVSPRAVALAGLGLLAILAVVVAASFVFYVSLRHGAFESTSPLAVFRGPPPAPLLQPSPWHSGLPYQDMATLNREYVRLSTTFGRERMPDEKLHDRIPVESAIRLIVATGMPRGAASTLPTTSSGGPSDAQ